MMTKAWLAVALPFLTLAACGGETERDAAAQPEPAATVAAAPSAPDPTATPDVATTMIPARFHGVWDAETGTCDPSSDLRLEIGPQTIGFYESLGTLRQTAEAVDGATVIALTMEGEGEEWEQTIILQLQGADEAERLLSQTGADTDAARSIIRRKRCSA